MEKHSLDRGQVRQLAEHVRLREVNLAQLREMLRRHRGLSTLRRAKAVFWWCYMHSECPLPPAEILQAMPTDDDIAELYRRIAYEPQRRDGPAEWGDGLVWAEMHHSTPWRIDWD